MKVFPVRYRWHDGTDEGTYYIVADTVERAEDIAYRCIAANLQATDRPAADSREEAKVWVMETWAAETQTTQTGLLGTGSENYNARAYAEYVKNTGKFR